MHIQRRHVSGDFLLVLFLALLAPLATAQERKHIKASSASQIVPGQRVGLLRLGDSRQRVEELFPKKEMDQEWSTDDGGVTFNWVDLEEPKVLGNVFVHLKEGVVVQIDIATTRFQTRDKLTILATPQQVRNRYPGLRAYVLSEGFSKAEGAEPLVYWVDELKGIAFAFAYYRKRKTRYLYRIIVFKPGAEISPEPEALSPSDKRELPSYSLDPHATRSSSKR